MGNNKGKQNSHTVVPLTPEPQAATPAPEPQAAPVDPEASPAPESTPAAAEAANGVRKVRQSHVSEMVRYEFTPDERADKANAMARAVQTRTELSEELATIKAQFKDRLAAAEQEINSYSRQLVQGYEMRRTECIVQYNSPMNGRKSIIHPDTGEVVREAPMEGWERQEALSFDEREGA